jgi:O-antigen ligase
MTRIRIEVDAMPPASDPPQEIMLHSPSPEATSPGWARLVLLVAAFSLPWSSDVWGGLGAFVSRVFNACEVLLVLYWAYRIPRPFRSMPRSFTLFALLVAVHTIVTYGVLHPGDLLLSDFEAALGVPVQESVIRAVVVVTLGLFFLLGYAVSAIADGDGDVRRCGFAMGASLGLQMLLGRSTVYFEQRLAGGYANPNAFAEVCAGVLFLNLHTVFTRSGRSVERLAGFGLAAIAIAGMLLSGSRSSVAGVLVGVSAMVLVSNLRQGFWLLLVGTLAVGVVAVVSSGTVFDLLYRRTTDEVINHRFFIWIAYLRQWRDYILFGVGLGREMTVLNDTILFDRIWPPHNTLLQTIVAYGILGPVLLVTFLVTSIRRAWQEARRAGTMSGPTVALGILCCWAALILMGERLASRVFWVMLGIVFAILRRHRDAAGGVRETGASWL